MIPLALHISNFRSFKKEQSFVFPQTPGLYFMQGVNEAEPQLEGNAAGKSTIWEALTWCIFGKTSRGLKAGDIGNWEAEKNARVAFDFLTPSGEECTLVRTWKPNSWRLHSTANPADFEDLDKAPRNAFTGWLGLDFAPWLHCILMAQNKPMFLDLEAPAKAALFSDVMGLDRWMEYASRASKRASREDSEIRSLERSEAEFKGKLDQIGDIDFQTSRKEWEDKRAARMAAIDSEYAQTQEYSYTKEDLAAAVEAEDKAREAVKQAAGPLETRIADLEAYEREAHATSLELARADQNERHAEQHLDSLEADKPCPTCGERLSKVARERSHAKALAAYKEARAKATKLIDRLQGDEQRVKLKATELNGYTKEVEALRKRLRAAEDDAAAARRAKLTEDKHLDALDEEYAELEAQVNPFDAMAQDAEERAASLSRGLVELREDLDKAREKHSIYSFWVRGFKEIRLNQIAEALNEFEIEVNSAVASLGLLDWELQFQVDRETAKGTLQRGFTSTVLSPHNSRAVPWEAWSGGEGQRLRLAGNMGLADLIRARTGTGFNLEVWDEPTQGLSPRGVTDLLESLAHRARLEQRVIWVVDHRTYSFGGFSGGATIVKAPSGSRIKQTSV